MRRLVLLRTAFCLLFATVFVPMDVAAQEVTQSLYYTRIYDFIDELATDRIISVKSVVKPYSRAFIAGCLAEAASKDSLLDRRQKADLEFFMNDYAAELDTLPKAYVHWSNKKSFDLSLVQPQFMYQSKNFKMYVRPILGMDISYNRKGLLMTRRWGAEIQMDIVDHVSVWGSLRDNSYTGSYLSDEYFPSDYDKMLGARVQAPSYLNNLPGAAYKEATYGADFSDFRGGIKAYAWWGSIGLVKDNLRWGDTYNSSNIFSDKAPSFPMITLNLKPCKWFEFNYIHGWMVSNVVDSSYWYVEETHDVDESKRHYRPMNKFIAANMFTFTPIRGLDLSFGNSIIYAERNVQALYFIPFAFFKSLDHLATKGLGTENQNSQVFINLSSRNIKHLHLYASFMIDEFSFSRLKSDNPEHNIISYKAGFNVSNWPLKNLSTGFEYTRNGILTQKHSIQAITFSSSSYWLGHYLGDNSQEFYAYLQYKPVRGLDIKLSYTKAQKGKDYDYVRENVREIISQTALDALTFENDIVSLKAVYEIWNNCYAMLNLEYNNARGYDLQSEVIVGENRLDSQGYLDKFAPKYYQGENWTVSVGLSIGF